MDIVELLWWVFAAITVAETRICRAALDVSVEVARSKGFRGSVVSIDFAEPMLKAGKSILEHVDTNSVHIGGDWHKVVG